MFGIMVDGMNTDPVRSSVRGLWFVDEMAMSPFRLATSLPSKLTILLSSSH